MLLGGKKEFDGLADEDELRRVRSRVIDRPLLFEQGGLGDPLVAGSGMELEAGILNANKLVEAAGIELSVAL